MCTPIAIAGLALSAGSAAVNSMAASKAAAARNDALAAERLRQQGYEKEADALNAQSQDRYQNFQGQQDQKAQQLGDYFAGQHVAAPAAPVTTMPASKSDITVKEEANQRQQAADFTQKTGDALGNLRAFGDLLGGIGRLQARDAMSVGQIGGFMKGSSNVLPYELDAASHAGDGLKTFGDILGGLGSVATAGGGNGGVLSGLFKGASPATGVTTTAANGAVRGGATVPISGLYGPHNLTRGALTLGSLY